MRTLTNNRAIKKAVKKNLNEVYKNLLNVETDSALEYSEWLNEKTKMRFHQDNDISFPVVKQGVYYIDFGINVGSEQNKDRPAVIVWSQKKSANIIAIPISEEHKGSTFWFHVHLSTGDTALVEQIRVLSKRRIRTPVRVGGKIRELQTKELKNINQAIDRLKFTKF